MNTLFLDSLPYRRPPSGSALLKQIAELQNISEFDIRIKAFGIRSGLDSGVVGQLPPGFKVVGENEGVFGIHFKTPRHKGQPEAMECLFFLFQVPHLSNVVLVVTDQNREPFDRVCRQIRSHARSIVELAVDQAGFRDLVLGFQKSLSLTVMRIVKVVKKPYLFREKVDHRDSAEISWGTYEIEEAFATARENNWWFKSISYALGRDLALGLTVRGSVSRDGVFHILGFFQPTYEGLLLPFCKMLQKNYVFLQHRERNKRDLYRTHPIVIRFPGPLFKLPDSNRDVLRILARFSNASVSVIHANPYIHAAMVDYLDGSSYDILVLDEESVTVVPQLRASPRSLQRICEFIWDNFDEGIPSDKTTD